jgi:hypothetical protein
MKNKKQNWSAPQNKIIKSIDISAVLFKPAPKANPYLRTPTYRKQKSVSLLGTNSEVY